MRIFISESVGGVDAVATLLRATANMLESGRFLGTRSENGGSADTPRRTPPDQRFGEAFAHLNRVTGGWSRRDRNGGDLGVDHWASGHEAGNEPWDCAPIAPPTLRNGDRSDAGR